MELNPEHVQVARSVTGGEDSRVRVVQGDFFSFDWPALLRGLPEPVLILGNPPWVTTATLGMLGSDNRPETRPRHDLTGLAAVTGRSNFDISQAIMESCLEYLAARRGVLAMLCKQSVSRKVLEFAWNRGLPVTKAHAFGIDSARMFGAQVRACLLVVHMGIQGRAECQWFSDLDAPRASSTFGMADGRVVPDLVAYERTRHLARVPGHPGRETGPVRGPGRWRSGVKHDCARVMELEQRDGHMWNQLGERVDIEDSHRFPLVKGSALHSGRLECDRRFVVVPQFHPGEDTLRLRIVAPRTWRYLEAQADYLDARASRIYRGKPRFSIFGIGPYSFSPWKVAVSGLHRDLIFRPVGPVGDKPVLFDDTCYFVPCPSREAALALASYLASAPVQDFFRARMFSDEKRPVTIRLLEQLDINRFLAPSESNDGSP